MKREGGAPEQRDSASPANPVAAKSSVRVETIPFFEDQRGLLVEPIGADEIRAQANVHLVLTEPGCVRGNHYHRTATEILVLFGPAVVRFREDGRLHEVVVAEKECIRFTIPPGVSHAFKNPGSRPLTAISFSTQVHDRARPDVVPDLLMPGTA